MKIKIESLGCRLNTAEIESVSTELQRMGHSITSSDNADIHIINACAVTSSSEATTRRLTSRALRNMESSGHGYVIVAGCGTGEPRVEGRVCYISNDLKSRIPEIVGSIEATGVPELGLPGSRFGYAPALKSSTTRANLKIQDGCDSFCSYCYIPYLRGAPVSAGAREVLSSFTSLVEAGYREIVLTGVMVGAYNSGGSGLPGILEKLLEVDGDFRIHLSSISPVYVDDRLIDLTTHSKFVKHLSISLQSGSADILKAMNRHYTPDEYMKTIEKLRSHDPLFSVTTDLIVGFPGETDSDFRDSLRIMSESGFSNTHIFRYSPRPGTKAYELKDPVPDILKKERSAEARELALRLRKEYVSGLSGKPVRVLTEKPKNNISSGFNEYYIETDFDRELSVNEFYTVKASVHESGLKLRGAVNE